MTLEYTFDKDGNPISVEKWGELKFTPGYAQVGLTRVTTPDEPGRTVTVSTVWLGIDISRSATEHSIPTQLFETMTFDTHDDTTNSIDKRVQYGTLAEATEGHSAMLTEVTAALGANAIIKELHIGGGTR